MSAPIGWVAGKNDSMIAIIEKLNLTANLKLCLDAGDINSYPGSGTKWLDTSGNGYDFDFGDGSTSSTYPTFNGVAGNLSANEFFSSDGGDYFSYDSANEPWMDELHNAGKSLSIVGVWTSPGTAYWISSGLNSVSSGVSLVSYSAGLEYYVYNAPSGISNLILTSTPYYKGPSSKMSVVGFSNTENSGDTLIPMGKGITLPALSSVFSNSNSGTPSVAFKLGAKTDLATLLPSGAKIACLAVWVDVKLTQSELQAIANKLQFRFG